MIYNKDFSLNTRFFEINSNKYEIIGTLSINKHVSSAIDTVKNLTNGKTKNFKRFELIKMFKNYEIN